MKRKKNGRWKIGTSRNKEEARLEEKENKVVAQTMDTKQKNRSCERGEKHLHEKKRKNEKLDGLSARGY